MVVDLVQDGAHEYSHDCSKDEPGSVVGNVAPVADPEFPENHAELGEVGLGVLVLELQGLAALLRDAQLLDQLLILPVCVHQICQLQPSISSGTANRASTLVIGNLEICETARRSGTAM